MPSTCILGCIDTPLKHVGRQGQLSSDNSKMRILGPEASDPFDHKYVQGEGRRQDIALKIKLDVSRAEKLTIIYHIG